MTKQEFLSTLSGRLYEELSTAEVLGQVSYYEGYIDGEVAKGRSEEEVTAELGDPLLIAKTIMEAPREEYVYSGQSAYEEGTYQGYFGGESVQAAEKEPEETPFTGMPDEEMRRPETEQADETVHGSAVGQRHSFFRNELGELNWGLIAAIAVVILIVVLFLWLVARVVSLLWPFIVVAAGIMLILSLIERR